MTASVPQVADPSAPPLDLFDLDEEFSSDRARLAQLANKCEPKDIVYFIQQCGDIYGVESVREDEDPANVPNELKAKRVLESVMAQLIRFKKLNPEAGRRRSQSPASEVGQG